MAMHQQTRDLLVYLQKNPAVRAQIRAPANSTLLYAGKSIKPMWQEIADLKHTNAGVRAKVVLPEALARVSTPGAPFGNALQWAKSLDALVPWKENGFIVWRALSGVFAANAVGTVSFMVGSGVSKDDKVFAATEIAVLGRNPNVDAITRDALAYYQRCLQSKQADMNFGFIGG